MIVETNSVSSYQGPTNVLYLLVTHLEHTMGSNFTYTLPVLLWIFNLVLTLQNQIA